MLVIQSFTGSLWVNTGELYVSNGLVAAIVELVVQLCNCCDVGDPDLYHWKLF